MNSKDHIEAAKAAASILANNNLTKDSRAAIIRYWIGHMRAYMKGAGNVIATN